MVSNATLDERAGFDNPTGTRYYNEIANPGSGGKYSVVALMQRPYDGFSDPAWSFNDAILNATSNQITGWNPVVKINRLGKMGLYIGTSSPVSRLQVNGDVYVGNMVDGVTETGSAIASTTAFGTVPAEGLRFRIDQDYWGTFVDAAIIEKTDDDGLVNGGIVCGFATSSQGNSRLGGAGWAVGHYPAMTIRGSGNVGIGTSNPQVKFQIAGLAGQGTNQFGRYIAFGDYDFEYKKPVELQVTYPYLLDTRLKSDASGWGLAWSHEGFNIGGPYTGGNANTWTMMFLHPEGSYGDNYMLDMNGNIRLGRITKDYSKLSGSEGGGPTMQTNVYLSAYGDTYFNAGNVGIGTTNPLARLHIAGDLRVDGDAYATTRSGGSIDVAEWIKVIDSQVGSIEAGDVVVAGWNGKVKKSTTAYQKGLVGVVSTKPHLTMGDEYKGTDAVRLALAGRVPVKVNTENGAIIAGDYLTSSSEAGVAMKAIENGPIIGVAVEGFDGVGIGKVMTVVDLGWYQLSGTDLKKSAGSDVISASGEIISTKKLNLGGHTLTGVKSISSASGSWSIDEHGKITAQSLDAYEATIKKLTTSQIIMIDQKTGDRYCIRMENAELIKEQCKN